MTSLKRFRLLALSALLLVSACNRAPEEPAPVETTQTPSPTPSPTPDNFELEGVVLEASGSARAENGAGSPSPGATGGTSPSPTADATQAPGAAASPDGTPTASPVGEAPLFQNAAPGSIALRLNSFTGTGPCVFNANDTVVVSFTGSTTFEPTDVTAQERFPNNLNRSTLRVSGEILEPEEGCVLLARSITVTQASPSPTPRGRTGRTSTTRSPTPRAARTATASPTPSPTSTNPSPAGGSPGAPGTPGA